MSDFLDRISKLSPKRLALLALEQQETIERLRNPVAEPIAIVGMSCRFPGGADSPEKFWDLLRRGGDGIVEVPPERWNVDALYDPDPAAAGKMSTRWGGFLSGLTQFDADFFGITPREAANMDPQQRLVLEVAWEALERSGYAPDSFAGSRTGVFIGVCNSDYFQLSTANDARRIDAWLASGSAASVCAGRVSYVLGLQGPSLSVDTSCSSSLVAIHLACQSLRAGECTVAIAGGVNAILRPEVTIALSRANMMAADGRCKAFDARADGFVRAEGCGLIVLKPLADAQAAGDAIVAVIRGTASNQDGRSNSLTAPNGVAQESVIRSALNMAGLKPSQISFVEAHGTGTSLGDPIEIQALAAVLGVERDASRPLLVGSVKTNIGHLESAAGVAGLIKAVLVLQHRAIPPHLHLHALNPHVDWQSLPVAIPTELTLLAPDAPGNAGVSSFGFSGTNGHVIIGEAPRLPEAAQVGTVADAEPARPRRPHLLPIAARTPAALAALCESYTALLSSADALPGDALEDICYSASLGRTHFEHRVAVTGPDRAALLRGLAIAARAQSTPAVARGRATTPSDIVFLFSGQGSQRVGMGRELYASEAVFRRVIDECDAALAGSLGQPLAAILFESGASALAQTVHLQPALFAFEVALAELWKSWGVVPGAVAGHSVGEFAAACVAGVFGIADGIQLVAARARLMQGIPAGGRMAAILADEAAVRPAIAPYAGDVSIAALNAPGQTVISGTAQAVDAIAARLQANGVTVHALEVSHAFHSGQMDGILAQLETFARAPAYGAPRIELFSNLTGRAWSEAERRDLPHYWSRHAREPVQFMRMMMELHQGGYRSFVEIGPTPVLLGLGRACLAGPGYSWLASVRKDRSEIEQLVETAAALHAGGTRIDWAGYYAGQHRRRVALPTYPFQRRRHWSAPMASLPGAAGIAASADSRGWSYQLEWRAAPETAAPAHLYSAAAPAQWIICAASLAEGRAFADAVSEVRCSIVSRKASETAAAHDECVVPAFDPAAIANLLSGLTADGNAPAAVLFLAADRSAEDASAAVVDECLAAAACLRALAVAKPGCRLWLLTRGAQGSENRDPGRSAQAALWGWGRVASLEYPQEFGGLVDLDPGAPLSDAAAIRRLVVQNDEDQWMRRGGRNLVARLVRKDLLPAARLGVRADGTYLVSGWMGGLAQLLVQWLAEQGAGALALVGRRAFQRGDSQMDGPTRLIDMLKARGVPYVIEQADIADAAQMSGVFRRIDAELPPLAGVFHTAGQLTAGPIETLDRAALDTTVRAKVQGALVLHELTRKLPIDAFVLFSSTAGVLGAHGLAHYGAANAVLDAIARARRSAGLAGTSIAWGTWSRLRDISKEAQVYFRSSGMLPMASEQALSMLPAAVASGRAEILIAAIDWDVLLPVYQARRSRPLIRDLAGSAAVTVAAGPSAAGIDRWEFEDVPEAFRADALTEKVRAEVARAMGRTDPTEVELGRGFFEMGMDSLMSVELRSRLASRVGRELPATLSFNYPNVAALAGFLGKLVFAAAPAGARIGLGEAATPVPPPSGGGLSEEHLERMLAEKLRSL